MDKNFNNQRAGKKKPSRAERRRIAAIARSNARKSAGGPRPSISNDDRCQYFVAGVNHPTKAPANAIDPLDALDQRFRKEAGWTRQAGQDPKTAIDVIIGMCRPAPEFVSCLGFRYVAFDRDTYRGAAIADLKAIQAFWIDKLNGRPFSMSFVMSALPIWKMLGIKVSPETTAYMMQLESVDAETSEAIQAAIWSGFNTSSGPFDLESATFVLASFLHADPLRKTQVPTETYAFPYGDRTGYGLIKLYNPDDEDGSDEG